MNAEQKPNLDAIIALNTLNHFAQCDAKGIYFNSPDHDFFDGSALGYWQRVAEYFGATGEEIAHAREPIRQANLAAHAAAKGAK